ncbi:MAG: tyrosine-protein phosphatase, partial [Myxococcota bacterium]|nr:tyrosine-protein phosphatase [Myxococcota bacterium]
RGLADIFAAEGRPDWMDPDDDPYERALTTLAQPAIMVKTLDYLDREFVGVEGYVRAIGLGAEHISNLRKALLE